MSYQSNLKSVISGGGGAADWNSLTGKPFSSLAEADFMVDDDGMLFLNPALDFIRNGMNYTDPIYIYDKTNYARLKLDGNGGYSQLEYNAYAIGVDGDIGIPYFHDGQYKRSILYDGMTADVLLESDVYISGDASFSGSTYFYGYTYFNEALYFYEYFYAYGSAYFEADTYFNGNLNANGGIVSNGSSHLSYVSLYGVSYFFGDIVLNPNCKILATRSLDGAQEVLIELGEYGSYEQTEVGSEARPLCLNHNSVGSDGTAVGKNIIVNYKNGNGAQQADAVAYLSDVRFLTEFPLNQEVNIRGNIYAKRVSGVYTGSGTNSITVSDSATGVLKMEGIWNGRTAAGMYNDGTDTVFAISPDGVHVFLSFEINSPSNKNYDIVVYYTK